MARTAKLAAVTAGFHLPIKQAVVAASRMGIDGIQLDARHEFPPRSLTESGRRQFLHMLSELNLQVASLHLPTRRPLIDQDTLDARIEAIQQTMLFASQLKASIVTVAVGRIPTEADSPERRLSQSVLNDLARYGNHVGVCLAIRPGENDCETLKQVIGGVSGGPVGVDFDAASAVMRGEDPCQALRTLHQHVVHYRIRDGIGSVGGTGQEVELGRGEVDWYAFLPLVDETAYRGWLTVDQSAVTEPLAQTERAVGFLKQLMIGL